MLVLRRRVGERIVINRNVHVIVVAINGNQVRLAIQAPEHISIDRQEVHVSRTPHPENVSDDSVN